MILSIPELVDRQNEIIKEQADIIDSLSLLLLQHVPASELDNLDNVKHVALLKEDISCQ